MLGKPGRAPCVGYLLMRPLGPSEQVTVDMERLASS